MSNQANTSDSIHFVAHARHYKAQRPITMLYTVMKRKCVEKTTSFIHGVHLNTHIRCIVCMPGCMIHQVNWHLKNSGMVVCLALAACLTQFISTMFSSDVVASIIASSFATRAKFNKTFTELMASRAECVVRAGGSSSSVQSSSSGTSPFALATRAASQSSSWIAVGWMASSIQRSRSILHHPARQECCGRAQIPAQI